MKYIAVTSCLYLITSQLKCFTILFVSVVVAKQWVPMRKTLSEKTVQVVVQHKPLPPPLHPVQPQQSPSTWIPVQVIQRQHCSAFIITVSKLNLTPPAHLHENIHIGHLYRPWNAFHILLLTKGRIWSFQCWSWAFWIYCLYSMVWKMKVLKEKWGCSDEFLSTNFVHNTEKCFFQNSTGSPYFTHL